MSYRGIAMSDPFEHFDQQSESYDLLEGHKDQLIEMARAALAADRDAQPAGLIVAPDAPLAKSLADALERAGAQQERKPGAPYVQLTNRSSLFALLQGEASPLREYLPPPLRTKQRVLPVACATRSGYRVSLFSFDSPVWDDDAPQIIGVRAVRLVNGSPQQTFYWTKQEVCEHLMEDARELAEAHPDLRAVGMIVDPGVEGAEELRKLIDENAPPVPRDAGFYASVPREHALDLIRRRQPAALDWLDSGEEKGKRRLPMVIATLNGYLIAAIDYDAEL